LLPSARRVFLRTKLNPV